MRDWVTSDTNGGDAMIATEINAAAKIADLQAAMERVIKGKSETVKIGRAHV